MMVNITVLVLFCQKNMYYSDVILYFEFCFTCNLLILKNKSRAFNHLDFNYSRDALQLVSYLWSAV